jgi:hypothetical protein
MGFVRVKEIIDPAPYVSQNIPKLRMVPEVLRSIPGKREILEPDFVDVGVQTK